MQISSTTSVPQSENQSELETIRQEHALEVARIRSLQEKELQALRQEFEKRKNDVQSTYRLEISKEAIDKENELTKVRAVHKQQLAEEEAQFNQAFQNFTNGEQKKIDAYRQTQEGVLARLQREYTQAMEEKKAAAKANGIDLNA